MYIFFMYQVWENNPYISGIYIKYSRLYVHIYIYILYNIETRNEANRIGIYFFAGFRDYPIFRSGTSIYWYCI